MMTLDPHQTKVFTGWRAPASRGFDKQAGTMLPTLLSSAAVPLTWGPKPWLPALSCAEFTEWDDFEGFGWSHLNFWTIPILYLIQIQLCRSVLLLGTPGLLSLGTRTCGTAGTRDSEVLHPRFRITVHAGRAMARGRFQWQTCGLSCWGSSAKHPKSQRSF